MKNKPKSFLVGKNLKYSYSSLLHYLYNNDNYNLVETTSFSNFLNSYTFDALSITNPFKHDAFCICDITDDIAKKTKVVNTILKKDGLLYGYNTDYNAFLEMLDFYNINLNNEKITILGNGSTSSTIKIALSSLNLDYKVIARTKKDDNDILISDINAYDDTTYLISAISYGTYPNLEKDFILDLDKLPNLKGIIDVNYNPFRLNTKNIPYYNGIPMLISNARLFESMYQNHTYENNTKNIERILSMEFTNIVLIGMPFSGKTEISKILAKKLAKKACDSDSILKKAGFDLSSFLKRGFSIESYRNFENDVIKRLSSTSIGKIIATGGGIVENEDNIKYLRQNGIIVFIDTPLDILKKRLDNSRPLLKSVEDLEQLYRARYDKYISFSDIIVDGSLEKDLIVQKIEEKIYEYFSSKWS